MFEAFAIGPFLVWTHLLFLCVAVWASTEFFLRLAQSAGLSLQHIKNYAAWHALAFLLMGRMTAILGDYRSYLADPLHVLFLNDGNFSFFGGAIGIAIVLGFSRSSRATLLQWLDVLLPATTFGLSFDWFGKFAAGQAYGAPSDAWWAVTYDAINVRYSVPIHPVQLYYALFFLALTFVLLIVRKHARRAGAETLVGIASASIATFIFELFRGDFTIPVFATELDFLFMALLFGSLGLFAVIEMSLSKRTFILIELFGTILCAGYLFLRPSLPLEAFELRFSQLLATLSLLAAVVYVIVHRRKYPHL